MMMITKFKILSLGALFAVQTLIFAETNSEPENLPVSGTWEVTLGDVPTRYPVTLPGTLNSNKVGKTLEKPAYGCLSPRYNYIGKATYTTTVEIPESLANKMVQLRLEKPFWTTSVLLDEKAIPGVEVSLATPHIHRLGKLTAGKHRLTIVVDNSQYVRLGEKGHAYGEHMQTIWNGILGDMVIEEIPEISNVFIEAPFPQEGYLKIDIKDPINGKKYLAQLVDLKSDAKIQLGEISAPKQTFSIDKNLKPWSEFTPNLYRFEILNAETNRVVYASTIGFRTIKRKGNKLFVNGQPFFGRANLDNCHFPLTGAPSMDKKEWMRIMKIQKDNGCNMIRFHSWCPPKVAFDVANELGLYLAPEAHMWIDGWMPQSSFDKKKYVGLGQGDAALDSYIFSEWNLIQDYFGNAPSFMMMCVGNELGNSKFDFLEQWEFDRKKWDSRHLYSASTARAITKSDDYYVTHSYPGLGYVRERLEGHTNWNYEGKYSKTTIPTMAHEIGQWPVYPLWDEIKAYTGDLRAWNLETYRDIAIQKGTIKFNKEFNIASGMLNKLIYKEEIESFMRTPSVAGIHLLGVQDYSGQGEALIGWLNSFYENKGYLPEDEVQGFFANTVILAQFPKYVYTDGEEFNVDFILHHYNRGDFEVDTLHFSIVDNDFSRVCEGVLPLDSQPNGTVKKVAHIQLMLPSGKYGKFELIVRSEKNQFKQNRWSLWVMPSAPAMEKAFPNQKTDLAKIVFTAEPEEAFEALDSGKTVLLDASKLGNKGLFRNTRWRPVYWSTLWFPGQKGTPLGTWIDPDFAGFNYLDPEGYADWNWWRIVASGRCFLLSDLALFRPYAMIVPDLHESDRYGAIFGLKVGKGNLLVCGYDLSKNLPEVQTLKASLVAYAANNFVPQATADLAWVRKMFGKPVIKLAPRPKEFEKASIYIECGAKLTTTNSDVQRKENLDRIETLENFKVETQNVSLWRDNVGAFWIVKNNSNIKFRFPSGGSTGKVLLRFVDSNKLGRKGTITFEGKTYDIPEHKNKPFELQLNVDREESLDGILEINAKLSHGPNFQIDRIVHMPNN